MTVHVLANTDSGPGVRGGTKPVFSRTAKPLQFAVFDYNMGTDAYSANGNDISAIWDPTQGGFKTVLYIGIEQQDTNTANDNRMFAIDYTAKTLLLYSAINTEGSGDQGVVTVRLLVAGY